MTSCSCTVVLVFYRSEKVSICGTAPDWLIMIDLKSWV